MADIGDQMKLHRDWFRFHDIASIPAILRSPLGYGVTAWTEDDALSLLRDALFQGGKPSGVAAITIDVDVSTLDSGHILPNMEPPIWRGIWFPRGFESQGEDTELAISCGLVGENTGSSGNRKRKRMDQYPYPFNAGISGRWLPESRTARDIEPRKPLVISRHASSHLLGGHWSTPGVDRHRYRGRSCRAKDAPHDLGLVEYARSHARSLCQ